MNDLTDIPLQHFNLAGGDSALFALEPFDHVMPYNAAVPHRHNYFEIFLFQKGGGTHFLDFKKYPILTESLHFVTPGQVHLVDRIAGSKGYVIKFSREFYSSDHLNKDILYDLPFFNNPGGDPVLKPGKDQFRFFNNCLETLREEVKVQDRFSQKMMRAILNTILIKAERLYFLEKNISSSRRRPDKICREFKILLEKNYFRWHSPSDYLKILPVTEKYLNEIIKGTTGKTVSEQIQDRIVLEAKRLLFHSGGTLKEIAFFLNFEDPSYFSKYFKRNTGLTPSQFRKEVESERKGK